MQAVRGRAFVIGGDVEAKQLPLQLVSGEALPRPPERGRPPAQEERDPGRCESLGRGWGAGCNSSWSRQQHHEEARGSVSELPAGEGREEGTS